MYEQVTTLVGQSDRHDMIRNAIYHSDLSTTTTVLNYIAEQIEMAYIAGANRVHIAEGRPKEIVTTGEILVDARNYVKDKGFKI